MLLREKCRATMKIMKGVEEWKNGSQIGKSRRSSGRKREMLSKWSGEGGGEAGVVDMREGHRRRGVPKDR